MDPSGGLPIYKTTLPVLDPRLQKPDLTQNFVSHVSRVDDRFLSFLLLSKSIVRLTVDANQNYSIFFSELSNTGVRTYIIRLGCFILIMLSIIRTNLLLLVLLKENF